MLDEYLSSGNGKQRAATPPSSQPASGRASVAQQQEDPLGVSEQLSEGEMGIGERPQSSSSVEEVPPKYDYLFPNGRPLEPPENAEGDPQGAPQGPNSCLLGATTEPTIAGTSAGSVEASAAGEGSGLSVDSTANAPRKRKRVSFAGNMTGDATGEAYRTTLRRINTKTQQDAHTSALTA
ncbi:hypothetical protein B0J12DRAFT_704549 [Macrophomina phaseolina]|uniref:Uncharacterized protein n=1 Tax=Macrophomina phaseolina TaxID=35725 RepID=A0ABQ8FXW3_9PEZI|nr:hypothetical protein B0J12DRAFT_704549 [Macrophomina phaseolina]